MVLMSLQERSRDLRNTRSALNQSSTLSQLREKEATSQRDSARRAPTAIPHSLDKNNNTPVQSSECIAHLKFLAAVAQLRESISSATNLFGIDKELQRDAPSSVPLTPEITDRLREKRWQVYVARAASRLATWWFTLPEYNARPTVASIRAMNMKPEEIDKSHALTFTKENLPPLDVLMVWHTFMLNPRCYLEDCCFHGRMNLWATPFPFEAISDSLLYRNGSFTYEPGLEAERKWYEQTKRAWDNVGDSSRHRVHCPKCAASQTVPWTTARITINEAALNNNSNKHTVVESSSFESATGFADKAFSAKCTGCGNLLTHDTLAVLSFRKDNKRLLQEHRAMRGTLLNMDGVMRGRTSIATKWSNLAPNYFLHALKMDVVKEMRGAGVRCSSMRDIASYLSTKLYRKEYKIRTLGLDTLASNRDMFGTNKGKGRGALRRMMSRYGAWTSSRFSMDLVGAVLRQGVFIQKMQAIDWLQIKNAAAARPPLFASEGSTALHGLMAQCIEKYGVFWDIIVRSPGKMAVPTLDVDLVWHTHQLAPQRYYKHSISTTKKKGGIRFIDHNDKVEEGRLSDAFEWTVKRYGSLTGGKPYSECMCWYCHSTRLRTSWFPSSSLLDAGKKSDDDGSETTGDELKSSDHSDAANGSHISTHNAVSAQGVATRVRRDLHRLVKKSQKQQGRGTGEGKETKGKLVDAVDSSLSKDDQDADSQLRIAEVFQNLPPFHLDAHVGNPGCFSVAKGAAGNCISHACGNAIGAGSCGGSAFGSACATRTGKYGSGFVYVTRGGAGGGGGGGCGGGCGGS